MSVALRLLMHFMGDVHQPLHTAERYTLKHRNGDRGGNLIKIKGRNGVQNLHHAWDTVLYTFMGKCPRPITYNRFEELTGIGK